MDEVVASVKRVTDIMAEITSASQEQSSGIERVHQKYRANGWRHTAKRGLGGRSCGSR